MASDSLSASAFEIRRLSGSLGAELVAPPNLAVVAGSDGADPRVAQLREALRAAFHGHGVMVLRDQREIGPAELVAWARVFGEPDRHPIVDGMADNPDVIRVLKPAGERASFGTDWHTDNSFMLAPSKASTLYAVRVPPTGLGDTVFASMERAYDTLSAPIRELLDGMVAIHSAKRAFDPAVTGTAKYDGDAALRYRVSDVLTREVEHPVIRTHPVTGRKSIYVNEMFTQRIVGLHAHESDALLAMLYRHCARPEFTCRLRWQPGTLALWDNRCVQHYAIDDYPQHEREMLRVTIRGQKPV